MVKYIEFSKVDTDNTVLEFRGNSEDVKIVHFTGEEISKNIVALICEDEELISDLVATQADEISCKEIDYETFKNIAQDSDQVKNINRQVKEMISRRYDYADEISMLKRDSTDTKRVAYEQYVLVAKNFGDNEKSKIGYN